MRRYFSRSLDKKDKVGLPAFGMQALCLPPERRVFKLCFLCELMAVIAGLVMFLSAYLLRFDATSTFGIMGAFFANVSLMCNLTTILCCLFMGFKLSAGKGSVYEAVDVLQGVGQTYMLVIFGANAAGMSYMFYALDLTTDDYLRWANFGFFATMFCYSYGFCIWYFNSYVRAVVGVARVVVDLRIVQTHVHHRLASDGEGAHAGETRGATGVLPDGSARRRDGDPQARRERVV